MAARKYEIGYDGEDERIFSVSDLDGASVEIDYGAQILRFRDANGNLKKEVDLFKNDEYSQWGVVSKYSKSGEYLALIGCNIYSDASGSWQHDFYVILFDKDGTEIWRRLIHRGQEHMSLDSDNLCISSQGNYILAAKAYDPSRNERKLILVSKDNNLVGNYWGIFGEFSDDERYIVVCGRSKVQLVETHTGNIVWTKEFPWNVDARKREKGWRWLNDVEVSRDASFIALSSVAYKAISHKTQYGDIVSKSVSEKPEIILINR